MCRRAIVVLLVTFLSIAGISVTAPTAHAAEGRARRPNVLVIVTDDQHIDTLAAMRRTRRIFGRWGTTFANAYVTTPVCCPARASLLTGRYAHNHGVLTNTDALELAGEDMLQMRLRRKGYLTAYVGKWLNNWPLRLNPPGFDLWASGRGGYRNRAYNVNGRLRKVRRYGSHFVGSRSVAFLREFARRGDARPWMLVASFFAPHSPWQPHPSHARAPVTPWVSNPAVDEARRRGGLADKHGIVTRQQADLRELPGIWRQQVRTLMSVDDTVASLFAYLKDTGEHRRTLAFFLTDNGYLMGEHGVRNKLLWYLPAVRTPLMVRWPGGDVRRGATASRIAANIDIAPTVLDAAGIRRRGMDGRSLLSSYRRDRLLIESWGLNHGPEWPSWAGLITRDEQYVEVYDARDRERRFREYYDLAADPWQLTNLLGDANLHNDAPGAMRRFSDLLADDRRCAGATCP
jgi:arylsulfatase A-like enzyme